jgi:hypothetical protein
MENHVGRKILYKIVATRNYETIHATVCRVYVFIYECKAYKNRTAETMAAILGAIPCLNFGFTHKCAM